MSTDDKIEYHPKEPFKWSEHVQPMVRKLGVMVAVPDGTLTISADMAVTLAKGLETMAKEYDAAMEAGQIRPPTSRVIVYQWPEPTLYKTAIWFLVVDIVTSAAYLLQKWGYL